MPFGDLFRIVRERRPKIIISSSEESDGDVLPQTQLTSMLSTIVQAGHRVPDTGARTTSNNIDYTEGSEDTKVDTRYLKTDTTLQCNQNQSTALTDDGEKYADPEVATVHHLMVRTGMAWTDFETKILQNILEREGDVSESFRHIRRGEDAIKRKWRKVR